MNGKVTYHQQVSYCGKPRCRKCREGTGHGPYWYAYQTVDGRTTRTYVGKQLPPGVQSSIEGVRETPPVEANSEVEQATIRVYMLGQFRLERRTGSEWQTVTDSAWQHQRVRALLGCLLSSAGRKLGREQLSDAIWPELDAETAMSRLDRAVYSLRQVFEPTRSRLATSPLLLTEREVLVLADQSQVWVDADAFEQLLAQAHASKDEGAKEHLFDQAATLYGGDFLPEEHKIEWTITRRETLQRSWVGILLELADLRGARENYSSAIEPLDRLLSIDATNEAAVQRLIIYLAKLDRRGEALRAYKRLASVLQQEYRIAPLPDTRALYETVRRGNKPSSSGVAPADGTTSPATTQPRPAHQGDTSPAVQIGRTHQSPLVGRDHEVEQLRALVSATENATRLRLPGQKRVSATPFDTQRRPQCVLLLGEVGIGKTRLAEEVGRDVKKRGWAVAWSRVYSQEGSIPYRLWTEILRKAMSQGSWQRQEVSKRPLVYQPLSTLLPELHELLPDVAFSSSPSPEQEQLRLWEAARELLIAISDGTPLLIVLDDLQWADGSSCELLAYLARRIQGHPIVIIGTCRDNELAANHSLRPMLTDLQRELAVETVPLLPLSDAQIGTLVANIQQLPEPIVPRIQTRAAGNPFFAEELARNVKAQVSGNNAQKEEWPDLPDTIAAVLDLRLSRLSVACQRLLSKAAVIGGSFEFPVICAMEANTPGSDEDVVLDLLEEALKSGMLTEEGTGTRIVYQFWHPLLVSHLYEKLSAARRASLHRRASEILREMYKGKEAEKADVITHHLVQGGADAEVIAHYAEMAGDRAYALSAYPDAEKHYRIAVEQIDERQADTNSDQQLHLAYLLECIGECMRVLGKYEDARGFYERALEVRKQQYISVSNPEYREEAQVQALLWCEIGLTWYDISNHNQALRCYQNGEQVLRDAGIVDGAAWAYLRLLQSFVNWREGNYEVARITAQEALKLFKDALEVQGLPIENISRATRIRRTLAGDPVDLGRTYALLGGLANAIGQPAEAIVHLNTALAIYEQHQRLRDIATVCCTLGDLHLRKAEHTLAQAVLRRSLTLAERIGDIPLMAVVFGNLGILATRSGELVEAEDWYKRGLVLAERINDPVYISLLLVYLAIVLQDQGKLIEAGVCLRRGLMIVRNTYIAPYTGFALVALANMRIVQAMATSDVDLEFTEVRTIILSEEALRILKRARSTLRHALTIEGLEAEVRTEGQLALALVEALLGELEIAKQYAQQTLEEARQFELMWLIARAQRILGNVLVIQNQREDGYKYLDQSKRLFHKCSMRLEYARTQHQYGMLLIQSDEFVQKERQRGLQYLQEAQQIFMECRATIDMQMVDRILIRYERVSAK